MLKVVELSYKTILDNINIKFKKNKINLISGSNKSGKTTFIKILGGIINSSDSVFYNNKDISKCSSKVLSNDIATILDNYEYIFATMNQELAYIIDLIDIDDKVLNERLIELLDMFNLADYLYKDINLLSDNVKIKFMLVSKLLSNPKILILDNVLDKIEINDSLNIINILKQIDNLTIIISSNNLELSVCCDYLYIFDNGKLILSGSRNSVLSNDSILNKIGLNLPFMADLSIKLKYYNLLYDIEFNMDRMIDILWKD